MKIRNVIADFLHYSSRTAQVSEKYIFYLTEKNFCVRLTLKRGIFVLRCNDLSITVCIKT